MKYVDTSAVLRILFAEPGPAVSLLPGDHVASSELLEVEAFRAVDRERLLGNLDDSQTAVKRKELGDLLGMLDLASIDRAIIDRAKSSFAVKRTRARCHPRRDRANFGIRGRGRATRVLDSRRPPTHRRSVVRPDGLRHLKRISLEIGITISDYAMYGPAISWDHDHSRLLARRAPSRKASNLAQTTEGWTSVR